MTVKTEHMKTKDEALAQPNRIPDTGKTISVEQGTECWIRQYAEARKAILETRRKLKYLKAQPEQSEQSEQEPVAWMVTFEKQDGTQETAPLSGRFKDVKDACDFGEPVPLYTASPKHELVWLSREDEQLIKENCTTVACVLKTVKAKLKELNHD